MSNVFLCGMQLSIVQPLNFILTIFIISLATFRIVKLITSDYIFEGIRNSLVVKIGLKKDGGWHTNWRSKIVYLIGCDICCGIWISLFLSSVIAMIYAFDNIFSFIVFWMAVAGLQQVIVTKRLNVE